MQAVTIADILEGERAHVLKLETLECWPTNILRIVIPDSDIWTASINLTIELVVFRIQIRQYKMMHRGTKSQKHMPNVRMVGEVNKETRRTEKHAKAHGQVVLKTGKKLEWSVWLVTAL